MSQLRDSGPGEHLGVAGSGAVACGLAACVAQAGGRVTVWARSTGSAGRVREALARECERADEPAAADRVEVTTDREALGASSLLVEAVLEDDFVKRELLAGLAAEATDAALIASTTSSLSIAALARASGEPARFFGLHVFTPVVRMSLVELCFPTQAAPQTRERAAAFCRAIGKTAVEVPDEPGFVVNRLLFPYLFDAVRLLERTGLEPEDVDACMKLGAAYPMGPLELLDFVGLDVADAIGEAIHADSDDPAHRTPGRIKQLIGEGRLGRKSGRGFYEYEQDARPGSS